MYSIRIYYLLLIVSISACTASKKLKVSEPSLHQIVSQSAIFNKYFFGCIVFDPSNHTILFEKDANKQYTPASNTKIVTLLQAITSLPDPLPSFKYIETGDSLIIKGMGDPTFLHPLWPDHAGIKFLQNTNKKIFLVSDQYQDLHLGAGWAWDDYQDDYQAEVVDFPMYGNLVEFSYDSLAASFGTYPSYFQNKWSWNTTKRQRDIERKIDANEFLIDTALKKKTWVPFTLTNKRIVADLLQDTLQKEVKLFSLTSLDKNRSDWKIQYSVPADSVYAQMMKISDNFVAEQLILLSGAYTMDTCHTSYNLKKFKANLFPDSLKTIQWYDGSGLSRYNLFTPESIIFVLNKIYQQRGIDWIKKVFPGGGESGTIKNNYKGAPTYVYAKTGSLLNNHSLSGYVHTQSGKWLLFSFMNTNYTGSAAPIRAEMDKILQFIRDKY